MAFKFMVYYFLPMPFKYYDPGTFQEFIKITRKENNYKILAGGTDVLVKMRNGWKVFDSVVDIKKIEDIPSLTKISFENDGLYLGSLATFTQIKDNINIQNKFPVLHQASKVMGCFEIRNRATVGGNICNASSGAEAGTPLLVLDTVVHIIGANGKRTLPLCEFYKLIEYKDGSKRPGIDLQPNELVSHFFIPYLPEDSKSIYLRRARTLGMDLASINLSMVALKNNKFRIAAGAVGPVPYRFNIIEEMLENKKITKELLKDVKKKFSAIITPRANSKRASLDYKKDQIGELLELAIRKCCFNN